jgi:antitoxin (DNA-binding transcriptional repressor) of toxin-antitoxin stability system
MRARSSRRGRHDKAEEAAQASCAQGPQHIAQGRYGVDGAGVLMAPVKWREFRENLADIIERVRTTNERVQITRHGKVVAEIGPPTSEVRTRLYNRESEAVASSQLTVG